MSTITVSPGLAAPRARSPRPVRPVRSLRTAPTAPVVEQRPGPQAGRVRLTRRGRLLVSALVVGLLVAGAVLLSGGGLASAGIGSSSDAPAHRVTVRSGETLWAIAQREVPGVDPRETIARILDLNALRSSAVRPGSVLLIPAG